MGAAASARERRAAAARTALVEARPAAVTARQVVEEFDDNAEAIDILKKSGPVGIFFLVAYILVDSRTRNAGFVSPYHYLGLAVVLSFFGVTWLSTFRQHWRLWSLLCCIIMITLIIRVSALTHDPYTRYITIILCPFATAAFVIWGWRWQLALIIACFFLYVLAEAFVKVPGYPLDSTSILCSAWPQR